MLQRDPRSPAEKAALFLDRFAGLQHLYGTYDPATGRSWQVKRPITPAVVHAHLTGQRPLGVYLLTGTHTRAIAVDYDIDDANAPIALRDLADHYELATAIETSKSKGYHVWTFFPPEGVPAAKARAVILHILDELDHEAEVFPKQDVIALDRGECGNFINLPFFGRWVPAGKTVFVDPTQGMRPYPNQWVFAKTCRASRNPSWMRSSKRTT